MLLQERHLVAYRQHVGGPASPSSIDRLFAELKGDGVDRPPRQTSLFDLASPANKETP